VRGAGRVPAAKRVVPAMPAQDSANVAQVMVVVQLLLMVRSGQRVVVQGWLLLVVVRRIAAERHRVDEHDGCWLFVERGGG